MRYCLRPLLWQGGQAPLTRFTATAPPKVANKSRMQDSE